MSTPASEVSSKRSPFIPPDGIISQFADIFIKHTQKQQRGIDESKIQAITTKSFNSLKRSLNLSQEESTFFKNYDVEILGRVGNSFNIVITDLKDVNRTQKVLSIARELSTNISLPDDIRQMAVDDGALAPKERIPTPSGQKVNISLSNKYQGSFESLYERKTLSTENRQLQCAINIRKMAEKLQDFQATKIFFPDAKVTNWLLTEDNDLIVTDDKSLRTFSQAREQVVSHSLKSFVHSGPYWPQNSTKLSDDSDFEEIHAYILGSNIYDYLTGREPFERPLSDDDFSNSVFTGAIGVKYKELIQNLRNPDPSLRMSLAEASQALLNIQYDIENKRGLDKNPEVEAKRDAEVENQAGREARREARREAVAEREAEKAAHGKVTDVYVHAREAKEDRYISKNVTVPAEDKQKLDKFKNFKGDLLKTKILVSLQRQIQKVGTKEELAELKEEIKKSPEYKVLATYQGLIQNKSDKGTKSVQALNKLFDNKESLLSQTEVDSPIRPSFNISKNE